MLMIRFEVKVERWWCVWWDVVGVLATDGSNKSKAFKNQESGSKFERFAIFVAEGRSKGVMGSRAIIFKLAVAIIPQC